MRRAGANLASRAASRSEESARNAAAQHDQVHARRANVSDDLQGEGMTDHDHRMVIAIDGPGAAGKSTVARELADRLEVLLFDTGALYRAVTLAALRRSIDTTKGGKLAQLARNLHVDLRPPSVQDGRLADVILDGEDVTWEIRTPEVDANVSRVSAHPDVREALLGVQRKIAHGSKVVMVGRDIGTVVTPDAGTKIYLDASVEERARRRYHDLRHQGVDTTYLAVLEDLQERDYKDSHRATAPMRAAEDAITIVSDGRSVDDIVSTIEGVVLQRWSELA